MIDERPVTCRAYVEPVTLVAGSEPSCQSLLSPQHHTVPSDFSAHDASYESASDDTPVRFVVQPASAHTLTGSVRSVDTPLPSPMRPNSPRPQHLTVVSERRAHVWTAPIATAVAVEPPRPTSVGDDLASVDPIPS